MPRFVAFCKGAAPTAANPGPSAHPRAGFSSDAGCTYDRTELVHPGVRFCQRGISKAGSTQLLVLIYLRCIGMQGNDIERYGSTRRTFEAGVVPTPNRHVNDHASCKFFYLQVFYLDFPSLFFTISETASQQLHFEAFGPTVIPPRTRSSPAPWLRTRNVLKA